MTREIPSDANKATNSMRGIIPQKRPAVVQAECDYLGPSRLYFRFIEVKGAVIKYANLCPRGRFSIRKSGFSFKTEHQQSVTRTHKSRKSLHVAKQQIFYKTLWPLATGAASENTEELCVPAV